MMTNNSLSVLSDTELLIEAKRLAASERQATADLIRSLAEVKARGLHLAMGFSSMFGYFATPQATAQEPPTNAPTQPPCPEPVERAVVRAIAPERYKLQVTIGAETRAKLRRAQDLLRHTNRSADEAAVIDRALTVLVEQLEKVKYGRTDRPRPATPPDPGSRYVPAHLRRAVSRRDGDRCAFVGPEGRCAETAGLQYHHRIPFADGGPTTVDNLELRCPAHNTYEAERWFGPMFVLETGGAWPSHRSAPHEGGRAWSRPSSSTSGWLNYSAGGSR